MWNLAIEPLKSKMLSSKLNKFVCQEASIRKVKPRNPHLTYFKSESIFPFMLHFACSYFNFIQKAWTTREDDSLFSLKMHFYLLFLVSLFIHHVQGFCCGLPVDIWWLCRKMTVSLHGRKEKWQSRSPL